MCDEHDHFCFMIWSLLSASIGWTIYQSKCITLGVYSLKSRWRDTCAIHWGIHVALFWCQVSSIVYAVKQPNFGPKRTEIITIRKALMSSTERNAKKKMKKKSKQFGPHKRIVSLIFFRRKFMIKYVRYVERRWQRQQMFPKFIQQFLPRLKYIGGVYFRLVRNILKRKFNATLLNMRRLELNEPGFRCIFFFLSFFSHFHFHFWAEWCSFYPLHPYINGITRKWPSNQTGPPSIEYWHGSSLQWHRKLYSHSGKKEKKNVKKYSFCFVFTKN